MHTMHIMILFSLKFVLYYTGNCAIIRLHAFFADIWNCYGYITDKDYIRIIYGNNRDPSHGGG